MMTSADMIRIKREGGELDAADIQAFVAGVASDSVSEAQVGAFLMAVYLNGMNASEQAALTLAMRDSGEVLCWEGLDGPILDKHSTGGVGDLVSLVLGPLLAACGAYVPMISGRGLAHTGGTLDKLESIPGLSVHPDLDRMRSIVREAGIAMVGQGPELAPADRRMYAVRDVTATVSSIPLIVSSILSKKLAEGLDGLVMDVKTGNGAFMSEFESAVILADTIAEVAGNAGLRCSSHITDMNQPLAWSVGNTLEMKEAIEFMTGVARNPRLQSVVLALGIDMVLMGGLAGDSQAAESLLLQNLDNGNAAERFAHMASLQGGPADLLENSSQYLVQAPVVRPVLARQAGYVARIDTREVGHCVGDLGGGRSKVGDQIDTRVGLSGFCSIGEQVEPGQPLAVIHAASDEDWNLAEQSIAGAIHLSVMATEAPPTVYGSDSSLAPR